jgi:hypothetical protein
MRTSFVSIMESFDELCEVEPSRREVCRTTSRQVPIERMCNGAKRSVNVTAHRYLSHHGSSVRVHPVVEP